MVIDLAGRVAKIDDAETLGLSGAHDSLAYRVNEVEHHFHVKERWFGLANTPSGEDHRGDPIGTTVTPQVYYTEIHVKAPAPGSAEQCAGHDLAVCQVSTIGAI